MRVARWGFVVIGIVLVLGGALTVYSAQGAIDYIKSCGKTVVTCAPGGNPKPTFFLSSSLTASLQEAEIVWVVAIIMVVVGLASLLYGVYLAPGKPERSP